MINTPSQAVSSPIAAFFAREVRQGQSLLHKVRSDLEQVEKYLAGSLKATNHSARLLEAMRKGKFHAA
jgi:hypothetical protein